VNVQIKGLTESLKTRAFCKPIFGCASLSLAG